MQVPDFSADLQAKQSSIRLGVPRDIFFEKLDPEVQSAVEQAIALLDNITAGSREVTLPHIPDLPILDTEAYAYHATSIAKSPGLYEKDTLQALRDAMK